MFDCHYDLLTYIYTKRNDIPYLKDYCRMIYRTDNVTGGILNLFFMTKEEMKEELNISKEELNIIPMLKCVKNILDKHDLIPNNSKIIYGIEGLDYLNSLDDIDILYDLGVRSIAIVWNNKNKFGSGNRSSQGLTPIGRKLVKKLVDKNIAIDLSHANENTFWDIINLCNNLKENGQCPIIFASHSNCNSVYSDSRNLTDEQIKAIASLDGVIGIVAIKRFCDYLDIQNLSNINKDFSKKYLEHILHVKSLLGGIQNICVSSDDMSYYEIEPSYYKNANVFDLQNISASIKNLLYSADFNQSDIKKILHLNFEEKILSKLI